MKQVKIGPYLYRVGPNTLGIGVDNLAFSDYRIATDEPNYGPRYNVRRSFSPLTGGHQFPLAPSGPQIGLRGDGAYMAGQFNLSGLTQNNSNKPGNG